jgi:hypothetical protein
MRIKPLSLNTASAFLAQEASQSAASIDSCTRNVFKVVKSRGSRSRIDEGIAMQSAGVSSTTSLLDTAYTIFPS